MKMIVMAAMASVGLFVAIPAHASEALAKSSGCLSCHAVDAKKVGPSFKEVSAKYNGKSDAEATVVAKLSAGKDHPEVKVKPDDMKTLVKWVLSQ